MLSTVRVKRGSTFGGRGFAVTFGAGDRGFMVTVGGSGFIVTLGAGASFSTQFIVELYCIITNSMSYIRSNYILMEIIVPFVFMIVAVIKLIITNSSVGHTVVVHKYT